MKLHTKPVIAVAILSVLCCFWLGAAARAQSRTAPSKGTERMVALLRDLDRAADPRRNSFLNSRRVQMISAVPAPARPEDLVRYLFMLGEEQLLAGNSAEAVESYDGILALFEEHGRLSFGDETVRNVQTSRALAYLRLGEQENCVAEPNADRCLLPIRDKGVHSLERGSRGAIAALTELLVESPDDLGLRWLLNIAYMTLGEFPDGVPEKWRIPAAAFESDYDVGRFYDVAPQLGLDVFGLSGGSIMDDFTGDGYLDIVASAWGLSDPLRLFVNNRDGTFSERTAEAGLEGIVGGLNIVQADYDNDGWLDILVLRGAWLQDDGRHPNSLLRNNGVGPNGQVSFSDVTEEAGLLSFHPTKIGAWADYDGDGWLDLFVGNESTVQATHPAELFHSNGRGADGKVTFTEVARETGVALVAYIKGAAWGDYDDDGRPDLYVANLSGAGSNFLYRNRGPQPGGGWRFEDVTEATGTGGPPNSFPTWFWDYDNDGRLDIFVSGYRATIADVASEYLGLGVGDAEIPALLHNNGPGENGLGKGGVVTFTDVAAEVGLDKVLLTMGANFGDLDNDGFLDFYVGTGDTELRSLMPNRMFRNASAVEGGGRRFQDVTTSGGFGHVQKGHGIAFGDLDNDGDQDIYAVMGGAHSGDGFSNVLFENPGHGNRWISLELEGVAANRSAIGARIEVVVRTAEGERSIYAMVSSGGSFGASSLRQEIGLGAAESIVAAHILWPGSPGRQRLDGLELDRFYHVRQGEPEARLLELERLEWPPDTARDHSHGRQ